MKANQLPLPQSILDAVAAMGRCPVCLREIDELPFYPDGAWCPECNAHLIFTDGTWGDPGCCVAIFLDHADEKAFTPVQVADMGQEGRSITQIDYVFKYCNGGWCYGPYLYAGKGPWINTDDPVGIWHAPEQWAIPHPEPELA